MQGLWGDITFALRAFFKSPGVCLLIVITLGLGIGANTAIFSVVYNILHAPLPFGDGERLVKVETHNPKINRFDIPVSVPTALDYLNQNESLSHLVEYHQMAFTLLGHGEPANVEAGVVSWDFFEMLSISPILGRTFLPNEDQPGAKPLIVLSHHYWREKFGSDPNIVGKNLEMNNAVHQVIGVLPPLPAYPFSNDIWIGSSSCPGRGSDNFIGKRNRPISMLYGKLREDVSLEESTLDLNTVSQRLMASYPDDYPDSRGLSNTLTTMRDDMVGESATTFYLLMGITFIVLLIACANVANLNLARMASRDQEFAIREALGATPDRILRQVMTESTLLSITGGALGLLIAYLSVDILTDFASLYSPLASEVEINGSVLIFSLLVSVLTGIASGIAAGFQRRNINQKLKEGSGNITSSSTNKKLRLALLVAQFSLSFIILSSASLISLSLYKLSAQDTGFTTEQVVALDLSSSAQDRMQFVQELAPKLEGIPEISLAGYSTDTPLISGRDYRRFFPVEGAPPINQDDRPEVVSAAVSANYHQILNISLLQGRFLLDSDDENSPNSIVVNQEFVEQHLKGINPIGKRISTDLGETWLTIRGVVGNIRDVQVNIEPKPTYYYPWKEHWQYDLVLLLKSETSIDNIRTLASKVIYDLNPKQAIANIDSLNVIKEQSISSQTLISILVSLFAGLAFIITISGVVGVVSYNVNLQRKEIGIRVALGANPAAIRKIFTIQTIGLCLIGLCLGLLVLILVAPLLQNLLFGISSLHLPIYLAVSLLVILSSILAALYPVKAAVKLQPYETLREQ